MKKLLAAMLSMTLCIQSLSLLICPSVAAQESGVLQFSDDFSGGLAGWSISKKQFVTIGDEAALYNDNLSTCTAHVAGETTKWGAATVTFGVNFSESNGGALQLRLRNCLTEYFTLLIRPGNNKSFRYNYKNSEGSKSETVFSGGYSLAVGVDYDIKVIHSDTKTEVYFKEAADSDYVLAGSVDISFTQKGSVYVASSNVMCRLTDFKLYNDAPGSFYFENKLQKAKAGSAITVQPVNNTGLSMDITYSSSNPDAVSVDENGKLTFISSGNAVITASGVADGVTYSDSFDAVSTGVITTFGFNGTSAELFVGDTYNVCAVIRPDNVENKRITWESSDSDILEIVGKMDDEKSIIAKAAGTAYITIRAADTDYKGRYREGTLEVTVKPLPDTLDVTFSEDGYVREIPHDYYGMHQNPLAYTASNSDKAAVIENEEKYADYYTDLKLDFIRFMLSEFDWEAGKFPAASSDMPSYSMSDIYTASRRADIPYVIAVGDNDSADKVVAMIEEIKNVTNQPIYIEMGNESWDIDHAKHFETVEDFAERTKEVYTQVKQLDENIKISVPVYEWAVCENTKTMENPSEQQKRFATWNDGLLEIKDYYDAVVIHRYSETVSWAKKSTTDIMDSFYNMMISDTADFTDIEEHFDGKEIWVTEFGDLPKIFNFPASYGYYYTNDSKYFAVQSESERARLQYGKSVGNAVGYAARLLNFLNTKNVTMASYHYFSDPQCFGVIQDDTKLPSWYMFDKMGDILDENTHYYKINAASEDKVTAYGFGDSREMKTVVFSNLSNADALAGLSGYKIKKLWSYGSSDPLPDFGTYAMEKYTSLPSVIPQPLEHDEKTAETISLSPYSITVAQVYCDELGIIADTEVDFQTGETEFDGVTTSGTYADGVFSLGGYKTIETENTYSDAIIELDFKFVNGERLDIKFNYEKDAENTYYNQVFFFANGSTLYEKGRTIAISRSGKMGDTRIQSDIALSKDVNYRFRIVKKQKTISYYLMNLDAENPEYEFIETLTNNNVNTESGKVVITAATSGSGQMVVPLALRVYDIAETDNVLIRNVSAEESTLENANTVSVSCDVYSFGAMQNALAFVALYDEEQLIGAAVKKVDYTDYKTSVTFDDIQADSENFNLKIFVWTESGFMPLAGCVEY